MGDVNDILEMFNVPSDPREKKDTRPEEGENDYGMTAKDGEGEKQSFNDVLGVVKETVAESAEGLPVPVDVNAMFQEANTDGAELGEAAGEDERKSGAEDTGEKETGNITGGLENDSLDSDAADADKDDGEDVDEDDEVAYTEELMQAGKGDRYDMTDGVEVINGQIQWLFDNDNDRFDDFYHHKKRVINENLPDGQIPYRQWRKDLQEAYVTIDKHMLYDVQYLNEKLHAVQGWQDRVTEIAIQNNASYYTWQTIVAMFEGLLARTLYEKPALKQQGVNFEHMRDMFLYWSWIKTIHESTDKVLKNLENKRETISRTVTIVLQNMEPKERVVTRVDTPTQSSPQYHRPEPPKAQPNPADLSAFDRLEDGSAVEPTPRGTREVEWSSMG